MRKLRLALNKGEELRFLSHLDFAKCVERTIRRANIEMAYSEGFNPHMKISFSSALGLGITAKPEYLDMDTLDQGALEDIIDRFNRAAPRGLEALDGKFLEGRVKKMMAVCNYAIYQVTGPVIVDGQALVEEDGTIHEDLIEGAKAINWTAILQDFNEQEQVLYEKVTPKKTKTIDVKHFVKQPISAEIHENGFVTLTMHIGIYPEGTIKPGELWAFGRDYFGWPLTDAYEIHRQDILIQEGDDLLSPLDVKPLD